MQPVPFTDLISATAATATGLPGHAPAIGRVCTDTRGLERGDLFWALTGPRHNGHDYVNAALAQGAVACVVARKRAGSLTGPLIQVDDTLEALGAFARWYRQQRETLVIGVTGSVGKTTTREMIHAVLSARHTGMRSQRNFNNDIGLPLSLLELRSDDEFGVLEMGAARVGDIAALCKLALPEVGVITQIGPAHLQSFGSLENIYRGKGELLESLPAHGFAVVGGDSEPMRAMADRAACQVIFVGEQPCNQFRATEVEFHQGRLQFTVDRRRYDLPATARHCLTAALSALAVAREIGMDEAAIAEGFNRFAGAPGRCQVEQIGPWTLIDDTYNANPLSMQAACLCLRDWPTTGNRLLIAGDMLELGTDAARCHQELGACVAGTQINRLLAYGAQAEQVAGGAIRAGMSPHAIADCRDLDSLLTVLDCWLGPGDVILVKGSRGMRMERVIDWLKQKEGHQPPATEARRTARAVA
ncbi:MAG: UDP-N-acetylmuramoyl-tripeptide--D-alanyl-D-alanine ligase [Planctomycetaceae bacterium]|nr:UDP-N-acetylmuramoyl-tripeptide--D-alanyl-D-alanine ligase [Planctomycetaceae bacterium]